MLVLTYKSGMFLFGYHLKGVGFTEHSKAVRLGKKFRLKKDCIGIWVTSNPLTAHQLRKYADDKAKRILSLFIVQYKRWLGAVIVPEKEKTLPHQIPSVLFALSRNRSYLALAPGLGKTIVAAIVAASVGKRTVYICPPSLTLNTQEEFKRWAPTLSTHVLGIEPDWETPDVMIIPDSMLNDIGVRRYIKFFKPKVIIYDEAERIKNPKTNRAASFLGYKRGKKYYPGIVDRHIDHLIYMSGTPTDGRPIELYSILKKSFPQYIGFKSYTAYGNTYCAPKKKMWEQPGTGKQFFQGMDYTGCNEKEFKKLVDNFRTFDPMDEKKFMLRQTKDLLGLPKLTETVLYLGEDMPRDLKSMDKNLVKKLSPLDLIKFSMAKSVGKEEHELHIAEYRKLLGLHKVKPSAKYYREVLEDTDEKIILSAFHKEVIFGLADKLSKYDPIILMGGQSTRTKQSMVKDFQTNKRKRVFILNYVAGGLGLTLTRANRIGLIEYAWGPNANRQVIDRGHRFTLKHPFLAQYNIFRNSLDAKTFETEARKKRITSFI